MPRLFDALPHLGRDVWIGALTTSVGFALAQLGIGLYLASVNLPWACGSAASLIVVLLWLYFSPYLFLLGTEVAYVYTREFGSLRGASNDDVGRQRSVTAITGE